VNDRDEFAKAALTAILINDNWWKNFSNLREGEILPAGVEEPYAYLAWEVYKISDAMLTEKTRGEEVMP